MQLRISLFRRKVYKLALAARRAVAADTCASIDLPILFKRLFVIDPVTGIIYAANCNRITTRIGISEVYKLAFAARRAVAADTCASIDLPILFKRLFVMNWEHVLVTTHGHTSFAWTLLQ